MCSRQEPGGYGTRKDLGGYIGLHVSTRVTLGTYGHGVGVKVLSRPKKRGVLTDVDIEPHRDARVLVKEEGHGQVGPRYALRLVEVTPGDSYFEMPFAHGRKIRKRAHFSQRQSTI